MYFSEGFGPQCTGKYQLIIPLRYRDALSQYLSRDLGAGEKNPYGGVKTYKEKKGIYDDCTLDGVKFISW